MIIYNLKQYNFWQEYVTKFYWKVAIYMTKLYGYDRMTMV